MPVTYERADEDVTDLVVGVMAEHHPELAEVDLRVCLLMAIPEKNKAGEPRSGSGRQRTNANGSCELGSSRRAPPGLQTRSLRGGSVGR